MTAPDDKKELNKLPPATLSLVVLVFLLILLTLIGLVFPQYRGIETARNEKITRTLLLEEQKQLFPLYAQAEALEKVAFEPRLPLSERKPLDRDRIFSLSAVFSEIALANNMKLAENTLDINSLQNDSHSISMDVQFTGSLFDYRNCLVALAELPFFDSIEQIRISTDPSNIRTFSTKMRITIEKQQG